MINSVTIQSTSIKLNFALCDTKLIWKKIVKHLLGYSKFSSKHFLFQAIGLNLFFLKTLKKDLTKLRCISPVKYDWLFHKNLFSSTNQDSMFINHRTIQKCFRELPNFSCFKNSRLTNTLSSKLYIVKTFRTVLLKFGNKSW